MSMPNEDPRVNVTGRYSIKETAALLHKSERTIRRYVKSGKLRVKYRKLNSAPFITGLEIKRVWNETW